MTNSRINEMIKVEEVISKKKVNIDLIIIRAGLIRYRPAAIVLRIHDKPIFRRDLCQICPSGQGWCHPLQRNKKQQQYTSKQVNHTNKNNHFNLSLLTIITTLRAHLHASILKVVRRISFSSIGSTKPLLSLSI